MTQQMWAKIVKKIERDFDAGYNEIKIGRSELRTSGVVYYTLKTASDTATRKMVIVD